MNRGQSCSPYFLRPFPLSLNSQRLLPPREHQLHPSHYLAGDQPAPGPLGKPAGAGTGPQDSGRRHGRGKPQPLSAGLSVVVRFGSSPHPVAAPSGPSSQDPLSRSPASGQATSSEHRQPPRQAPPAGVPGSSARPDQCASARGKPHFHLVRVELVLLADPKGVLSIRFGYRAASLRNLDVNAILLQGRFLDGSLSGLTSTVRSTRAWP